MKALSCDEPLKLSLVDRPVPVAGADEVLVRIRHVGVCGTDYHIYHGNQPYLVYPRVIGHELGGEVVSAPAGSAFRPGDVVAIEPYLYCGECRACRMGRTNCCRRLEVLGVHRDGGAGEFLAVPERNVVPATGLSTREAAMVEFLAIGAHGVRRSAAGPQNEVLIVGAGPIGISAAIFAKQRGARVTVADRIASRLEFCESALGVGTIEASADLFERLGARTGGEYYDVVIDATGSPAAMQQGFAYVGHGGTYVLLSIVRADITFSDPEFHKRETSLLGSRNATREDFETVLAAMRGGNVPVAALATHRGLLVDAPEAIPLWSRPEAGVIKAILEV
ncbi:dehydrogenase [Kaistia algarum]|uniref:zinc-binding alcohol dehydrogenase family protein n=1 Tax=Kaistia algarum TaxID=2083279 RepID=UPI000CE727B6|nr:zinc-binding alcohol dehydrogenase family protein [Kaistia algarum]MCX5513919.1 zinc-binding alcohol dehydrogenase family protein [Kaistia algarum]PPE77550.1 dehydrogenase [Kaistia algarum]